MSREFFTVSDITDSILNTSIDLGHEVQHPYGPLGYGGTYTRNVVYQALEKARKDGGDKWRVPKKPKSGRQTITLDSDHATGIFEALNQLAMQGSKISANMESEGITKDVLFRAEEVLFTAESTNQRS